MSVLEDLKVLDLEIKSCQRCSLRKDCVMDGVDYGPTLPEGYCDVEIMTVARNPGKDELVAGRPLVGKAGHRFDSFLGNIGLDRRFVWITNSCKCFSEGNRCPTKDEIKCCSEFLRREISIIKPKFIITFGNEAMNVVIPGIKMSVSGLCGSTNKYDNICGNGNFESWVGVCVHPSYAMRSSEGEKLMQRAERSIKEFLEKKL